ncbi:MAG: hypothetical protein EZS28_008881 [Streblomastix strix]|uniref:Uncharacterized protein n=1 Tax=Streblomastix strix TaxID=222440 RepID=A0A5J4WM03_9EUKA|nr:MAG: hypothetical protein EZS28_008881 [Streblomastix strix]
MSRLEKNVEKLECERIVIEDKMSNLLNEKLSFDKFGKAMGHLREKMLERVCGQDIEAGNVMNEVERVKLDMLNRYRQADSGSVSKGV